MKTFLHPPLTPYIHGKFAKALAMHYCCTGTSFQRIGDNRLLIALRLLHPDVKVPTRQRMAGNLLESCYLDVKANVQAALSSMNTDHCCLVTDGWSNVRLDPIVNYVACIPATASTLFLESVATGPTGHSGEWIAEDLARVIRSVNCNVAGAVTDNTSANKRLGNCCRKHFQTNSSMDVRLTDCIYW